MKTRVLSIAICFLAVLGAVLVWIAGSILTKPVPEQFNATPQAASPVEFDSQSRSTIRGWLYEATEPVALAVLMHGVRSNRGQMVARAEHLQSLGITAMVFDFQAHGESTGEIITLGYLESLDAQAAVDFVSELNPELPKLVVGVSMGGAAAIMSEPALEIDALIVESVYPDIKTAIGNRLASRLPGGRLLTPLLSLQIKPRIGVSADELAPDQYAKNVDVPTLVLSGRKDRRTTVADTQRLMNALNGEKQLYFFDSAGHDDLERFDSKQYWGVVEPFIKAQLGF